MDVVPGDRMQAMCAGAGTKQPVAIAPLPDDRGEDAVRLFSRAFHADPLFRNGWPDEPERARCLPYVFRWNLRHGQMFGLVLATADSLDGVVIVYPPGDAVFSPERIDRSGYSGISEMVGPAALSRFNEPFFVADMVLRDVVTEPHWYLDAIAVDPARQRTGVGSALLREIGDRADAESMPVVLLTFQPQNVPLYEKHGYERVCGGRAGAAGLEWWGFRRPPRQ